MKKLTDYLFLGVIYILPRHFLSVIARKMARSKLIKRPLIKLFIRLYDINLTEIKEQDLDNYSNFNEFFTRELKKDARPLAVGDNVIVSPADGMVSQCGKIAKNILVQAKGKFFTLEKLLGDDDEYARNFYGGSFITIYLSPRDYHRVHMPCAAKREEGLYVAGSLFPVNQISTVSINNLFARNERLVTRFNSDFGKMAVIMVGAMLVSGIETVDGTYFAKGAEFGRFNYGSTVIVLMPPGPILSVSPGRKIKMGEKIAYLSPAQV